MTEAEWVGRLEAVCLRDMAVLAGVAERPLGRLALRLVFGGRVRRFARDVAGFDRAVGRWGVATAARRLARRYGGEIVADAASRVPRTGPLLLVANHPGLYDVLAICATLPRRDLLIFSRPQPLLALLPEMGRHLLIVPETGPDRARGVRAMLRHLRDGGALLLFPAGQLEPEPTHSADRASPLADWSPGAGALVQLAAKRGIPLRVVPTAISGVFAERIWRRFWPLIRLRRTPQARADLATVLQLVFPRLGATTVRVRYGEPLEAATLAVADLDAADLSERLRQRLQRVLVAAD